MLLLGLPYSLRSFSFEDIVAYDKIIVESVGSSGNEFRAAFELPPRLCLDPFLQSVHLLVHFERTWEKAREGRYLKNMLEITPGGASMPTEGETRSQLCANEARFNS